ELGITVASVGLRGEPTGAPDGFRGDVVATAKRELSAGETLDGEGGYTVWGKLLPAATSRAADGLPLALAHGVTLKRAVAKGDTVRFADVAIDTASRAYGLRREMERRFAPATAATPRGAAGVH
ncbi:MAG TPA: SAF domain-containing protein, partial [Burkholderiaceae bacterium]|nr:SAF domain-containing protein [Burkholderiaceae bacterium]